MTGDRLRTSVSVFGTVFRNPGLRQRQPRLRRFGDRRLGLHDGGRHLGVRTVVPVPSTILATVRYFIQAVLAPVMSTLADRFDKRES